MIEVKLDLMEDDIKIIESYKSIRTNILLLGSENKVIAITSCASNEGKSTVALQLAKSLSDIGKKVLLIDADLRNSTMIKKLLRHKKEIKGLSHLLSGQCELSSVLCEVINSNLHIIFAGPEPTNPTELLSGKKFEKLLENGRDVYDYILVDTPPLGEVIDSAVIATNCDGALLVLESSSISYKIANKVKNQLEKTGCDILGVILNKMETDSCK